MAPSTNCFSQFSDIQVNIIRCTSIVVCLLSILGSLLIILSYIVFKSLRSKVRFLLVNLSIMDFGVGCANLFGLLYRYQDHLSNSSDTSRLLTDSAQRVCLTQAFFAICCTLSSIIWTILLSSYLYLLIAHQRSLYTKYAFLPFYALGYGVPLLLTLWLLLTNRLGYAPYNSAGWCTVKATDTSGLNPDVYITVIGYDLWIYMSFVLVPVFCVAVHLHIKHKLNQPDKAGLSHKTVEGLYQVHYKFLAIPVWFIFFRLWTCILSIVLVYIALPNPNCHWFFAFTLLSGIGDSGQGMTNGVLFVLFNKTVRSILQRKMPCCRERSDNIQASSNVHHASDDSTA